MKVGLKVYLTVHAIFACSQTSIEQLLNEHSCVQYRTVDEYVVIMWRCILADRYVWQKDGATLESSSSLEIRQTHEVSTIHIENPTSRHEGFYQCFASNVFGTAVTVKALLRKASKIYARVCSLSVTLQKSLYRHCIASDLVYLGTVLTILHIVTARQCIAVVMIVCHTSVLCGNGCAGQAALVFFWGHLSIISLWNFVQTLDLNSDRRC